ncbi:alpha/beta fold hydrolase [Microbacterium sp. ARD31]|uniref:alpha/beta fold hydrolase n=1 Tax=Microbacterium sp. ARD31 TaxID=2962576 RepID=UPI002882B920|nr:alpha/beta fold hydrolase [Microbacterium sp. ARD31]MDT0185427.1 alpha/beta fold hydrolase [Microbacterium sp. ARD31]
MTRPARPLPRRRHVPREQADHPFDLAVFEGGVAEGPVVVLVHGWPDTHRMWDGVAELLAPDFRVVAYDTRGQGASATDAPDSAFTVDALADDLFAVLDAVARGEQVHLVGHDWGSVQAWEAVCRPEAEERIASFTSISGPHLDHVAHWVRRTVVRPSPRAVAALLGQAVSSSYLPFLVSPLAPPLLGMLDSDAASGLRYYRGNLRRRTPRSAPPRTSVPVLQLALTRDVAIRHASLAASDPWADRLERRELPHGHWVARTHPHVVAAEVADFVRRHDRRASAC